MREIKFRAWDGLRMTTSGIQFNTSTGTLEFIPKGILIQFTGLHDKNGKEIWEGDIVGHGYQGCIYGEVAWGDYEWRVKNKMIPGREDFYADSFFQHPDFYEVFGNIYENPELLKGTQ